MYREKDSGPCGRSGCATVLITNDNPFSMLSLAEFLAKAAPTITLVAVTTALPKARSNAGEVIRMIRRSGIHFVGFKLLMNIILPFWLRLLRLPASVTDVLRQLGYSPQYVRCSNANHAPVVETIRSHRPDLLIAAGATTILSPDVLRIPRIGAVNLHPSLLPAYAGTAPCFWPLVHGEACSGATLHVMAPRVDSGSIVAQRRVDLSHTTSVLELMLWAARANNEMLIDAQAAGFALDKAVPQDLGLRTYYGNPPRTEVARLHSRGKRLVRFKDLRNLIAEVRRLRTLISTANGAPSVRVGQ